MIAMSLLFFSTLSNRVVYIHTGKETNKNVYCGCTFMSQFHPMLKRIWLWSLKMLILEGELKYFLLTLEKKYVEESK